MTDLVDELARDEGPVLIEGGHNQFNLDFSLSGEDAAYYQRYLEGLDTAFEQVNDVSSSASAARLDDVAAGVGSDLRLGSGQVRDGQSNLNDDPGVLTTGNFGPGKGHRGGKNGGKGNGK